MKIYEIIGEALPPRNNPTAKGHSKKRSIANDVVTYIGPKATQWDAAAAKLASEMEKNGSSRKEIHLATGTIRGPKGNWYQEISNHLDYIKPNLKKGNTYYDNVHAPEVYKAHPNLKHNKMNVNAKLPKGTAGSYNYATKEINVSGTHADGTPRSNAEKMAIISHEFQHPFDRIENRGKGGSPDSAETKDIARQLGMTPSQVYRGFPSEILARSTERRQKLTPAQRREIMPSFGDTSTITTGTKKIPYNMRQHGPGKKTTRPGSEGSSYQEPHVTFKNPYKNRADYLVKPIRGTP